MAFGCTWPRRDGGHSSFCATGFQNLGTPGAISCARLPMQDFGQWRPTSRSLAMGRTVLTTRCREARGSYHGLPTRLHSRAGSVKQTSTSMQESPSGQGSYYRNVDANWELLAPFDGAQV